MGTTKLEQIPFSDPELPIDQVQPNRRLWKWHLLVSEMAVITTLFLLGIIKVTPLGTDDLKKLRFVCLHLLGW